MIIGIGVDVAELDRIEKAHLRFGERFLKKLLTEKELALLDGREVDITPILAAQFAGKEAASKALGTGFRRGVSLRTIQILREPSGKPTLEFLGPAHDVARALGVKNAFVSLTHGRDVAVANVVLEK